MSSSINFPTPLKDCGWLVSIKSFSQNPEVTTTIRKITRSIVFLFFFSTGLRIWTENSAATLITISAVASTGACEHITYLSRDLLILIIQRKYGIKNEWEKDNENIAGLRYSKADLNFAYYSALDDFLFKIRSQSYCQVWMKNNVFVNGSAVQKKVAENKDLNEFFPIPEMNSMQSQTTLHFVSVILTFSSWWPMIV